jgi:hypothetical protein
MKSILKEHPPHRDQVFEIQYDQPDWGLIQPVPVTARVDLPQALALVTVEVRDYRYNKVGTNGKPQDHPTGNSEDEWGPVQTA